MIRSRRGLKLFKYKVGLLARFGTAFKGHVCLQRLLQLEAGHSARQRLSLKRLDLAGKRRLLAGDVTQGILIHSSLICLIWKIPCSK